MQTRFGRLAAASAFAHALVLGCVSAAAQEPVELVSGPDYRPFADYPENFQNGGMATELVREALGRAGIEPEIAWESWADGLDRTIAGDYDGTYPYFFTDERAQDLVYSDSMYEVIQRVFFRDDSGLRIDGPDDMRGLTVCSPTGYAVAAPVRRLIERGAVTRRQPPDMTRCFELLSLEQVDGVLANDLQGWELVDSTSGLASGTVLASEWEVYVNTLSLIAPKRHGADACRLAMLFNGALAAMRADGSYDAIVSRWLSDRGNMAPADETYRIELVDGTVIEGRPASLTRGIFIVDLPNGDAVPVDGDDIAVLRRLGGAEFADSDDFCRAPTERPEQQVATPPVSTAPEVPETVTAPDLTLAGAPELADRLVRRLLEAFVSRGRERAVSADAVPDAPPGSTATMLMVDEPARNQPQRVDVLAQPVGYAFADLAIDRTDVVLADRAVDPQEASRLDPRGNFRDPRSEHIVALQGAAAIVHPRNAVRALSEGEIVDVLSGRIADWSQLGGARGPITVYDAQQPTAAVGVLIDQVPGFRIAPGARTVDGEQAVVDAVMRDPSGFGVVSMDAAAEARPVPVQACDAVYAPQAFAVKTEEYPLMRRLYMYLRPDTRNPFVGEFVAFAESDEGQAVVQESGFVDLRIVRQSDQEYMLYRENLFVAPVQNANTVRDMMAETRNARRVSITFRFQTGSDLLDNRALRDVRRLAAFLRQPENRNAEVLLLGFADERGAYEQNRLLSRNRAQSVARQLSLEGIDRTSVLAVSEELPVACNDTAEGRALNRRVEVWLR